MELIKNNEKPRRKSWGLCLKVNPQLLHRVFSMVSLSSDRINHKQRETSTTKMGFIWAWRPAKMATGAFGAQMGQNEPKLKQKMATGTQGAQMSQHIAKLNRKIVTGALGAQMGQNKPKLKQKMAMGTQWAKMSQHMAKLNQKMVTGALGAKWAKGRKGKDKRGNFRLKDGRKWNQGAI
jgi:hypothetical protein